MTAVVSRPAVRMAAHLPWADGLPAPARRHHHQGSAPARPRPADLRHDVRPADHAAPAVRLRHRHRSASPADGRRRGRPEPDHAHHPVGAGQHRLHALHPPAQERGRGQRAAAKRRGAVRRHHPLRLHAPAGARRARPDPDRCRRHRSDGGGQSAGRRQARHRAGAGARPGRSAQLACAAPPIPSMSCCSAATTPKAGRT